ncbi:MAG: AsmA-like C-terminal region-containing protein [Verrucomicrobiota bacterium]|jgi:hypothetical protein|nr:AsmA-like C-terminal region-containing protein [Verrucomicrobiota bacterium]
MNSVKPSPEHMPMPSASAPRRLGRSVWHLVQHAARWGIRLFLFLLLLSVAVFSYLHLVGFPTYFTNRFLDRLAGEGYYLQVKRVTLELDRGMVAQDVRIFPSREAPEALLEAKALTVAANPFRAIRQKALIPVLTVEDGSLRAAFGGEGERARQGRRELLVEQIQLSISASEHEYLLRRVEATFLGIRIQGRGAVYPAPEPRPDAPQPMDHPLRLLTEALDHLPESILLAVEQLNEISFPSPPTAHFTFAVYMAHPQQNTAFLRLFSPEGIRIRGVDFDEYTLEASWKNHELLIPDIQLHRQDEVLSVSGRYNTTNQMVSAHVYNTLPPSLLLDMGPPELRTRAAELSTNYDFPLQLDLRLGPAPLTNVLENVSARVSVANARIQNVPIEALSASVRKTGAELILDQAELQLAEGPHASRVHIQDGSLHLGTRRFQATLDGSFNPHHIKPLLTPNMQNIVNWFEMDEPGKGRVQVGGTIGDPAIYCYGPVWATNLVMNGVLLHSVQGYLNITNEVMHLTHATILRPEGAARGELHMAFSNQTLRMDVESTLNPRDTAALIGPGVENFMMPFRLNGPTRIHAEGLIDYFNFSLNQLQCHVEAKNFGFDRWEADAAEFDLLVKGRQLTFTNVNATAYGGQAAGAGRLYPVQTDADWRYEVQYQAQGVQLSDLLEASLGQPTEKLRGTVDSRGAIQGYIGPHTGPHMTGNGRVDIRNGLIFETPLFTGLTSILSRILPDFNWFAQTDAGGTYTIHDSRIYSRDIQLEGNIFSVKARGSYGFDESLNYRVEVQLLRGGPVATLVRLATWPVTRLLEFRLTGTFENPSWRPENLNPADLFN